MTTHSALKIIPLENLISEISPTVILNKQSPIFTLTVGCWTEFSISGVLKQFTAKLAVITLLSNYPVFIVSELAITNSAIAPENHRQSAIIIK